MENAKNDDQKILNIIRRCEYKEEAMELLKSYFGDKPVKLDLICWSAFNNLRSATHPFKTNKRKEIIEKNHGNGIIGGQGRSKESIEASAAIVLWCLSASIVGLVIVLLLKLFKLG